MKALVYHGNKDLRVEEVLEPETQQGQVKLAVDFCGICATDIEEYLYGPVFISGDTPNPVTGKMMPLVTGHEITGTVIEIAPGVSNISIGDRVALNGVLTCEKCYWCKSGETTQCPDMAAVGFAIDGGLAERIVWRADRLVRLPDEVNSKDAALIEPTSVAIHAVRRSGASDDDTVAIIGVGTVGMLAMQAAKSRGAKALAVDPRQMSLDLAAELGADATINPLTENLSERISELTDGVGPDIVIDAAGSSETTALSVDLVRSGGHVVLVAIYTSTPTFDFNSLVASEVRVSGSLAYQQKDVEEAVRLIAEGKIKTRQLISDIISLDQVIDTGFKRMLAPTKDVFRILVSPNLG